MKKQIVLVGIFSLVLVFGLVLAGCPNDSGSSAAIDGSIQGRWYDNSTPPQLQVTIEASRVIRTIGATTDTYSARTYPEGSTQILEITNSANSITKWTYTLVGGQLTITIPGSGSLGPLTKGN